MKALLVFLTENFAAGFSFFDSSANCTHDLSLLMVFHFQKWQILTGMIGNWMHGRALC